MKTIKSLLVYDNSQEDDGLNGLLSSIPLLDIIGSTPKPETAVNILINQQVDLVFIEINTDNHPVIPFLKAINYSPAIIIISNTDKFALKAFEFDNVVDYLIIPVDIKKLTESINRAKKRIRKSITQDENSIFLKKGRKMQRYDFNSILYIKAYGLYSKIIKRDGRIDVVNERLVTLQEILPYYLFKRIQKSFIINIANVTSFDKNYFWIDEIKIPIGNKYKDAFDKYLRLLDSMDEIGTTSPD